MIKYDPWIGDVVIRFAAMKRRDVFALATVPMLTVVAIRRNIKIGQPGWDEKAQRILDKEYLKYRAEMAKEIA